MTGEKNVSEEARPAHEELPEHPDALEQRIGREARERLRAARIGVAGARAASAPTLP